MEQKIIDSLAKKGEKYLLKEIEKFEKEGIKVPSVKKPVFSENPEKATAEAERYLKNLAKAVLTAGKKETDLAKAKSALKKAKIETSDLKIGKPKKRKKS
jgi:methionine synthase II (cobalamin-independent)